MAVDGCTKLLVICNLLYELNLIVKKVVLGSVVKNTIILVGLAVLNKINIIFLRNVCAQFRL